MDCSPDAATVKQQSNKLLTLRLGPVAGRASKCQPRRSLDAAVTWPAAESSFGGWRLWVLGLPPWLGICRALSMNKPPTEIDKRVSQRTRVLRKAMQLSHTELGRAARLLRASNDRRSLPICKRRMAPAFFALRAVSRRYSVDFTFHRGSIRVRLTIRPSHPIVTLGLGFAG